MKPVKGIRLPDHYVQEICKAFRETFAEGDHLWLFGSRTDLSKRGGDIDLYVETSLPDQDAFDAESNFLTKLYWALGEQKIDVVVRNDTTTDLLVYKIAQKEGILLV